MSHAAYAFLLGWQLTTFGYISLINLDRNTWFANLVGAGTTVGGFGCFVYVLVVNLTN